MEPPRNVLDLIAESGRRVHAIGKISEFFNGRGIHSSDATTNNADHSRALIQAARLDPSDLIFANLEDFDMLYGHRNDPIGFAEVLETFDSALGQLLEALRPGDLLILTNDHGNDPTTPSTDHSREYAFILAYGPELAAGRDLGIRGSFADLGATVLDAFGLPAIGHGESFLSEIVAG